VWVWVWAWVYVGVYVRVWAWAWVWVWVWVWWFGTPPSIAQALGAVQARVLAGLVGGWCTPLAWSVDFKSISSTFNPIRPHLTLAYWL
jgi:hypothetical protein